MSIVKNEPKYKNGLLQAIREQLAKNPVFWLQKMMALQQLFYHIQKILAAFISL